MRKDLILDLIIFVMYAFLILITGYCYFTFLNFVKFNPQNFTAHLKLGVPFLFAITIFIWVIYDIIKLLYKGKERTS